MGPQGNVPACVAVRATLEGVFVGWVQQESGVWRPVGVQLLGRVHGDDSVVLAYHALGQPLHGSAHGFDDPLLGHACLDLWAGMADLALPGGEAGEWELTG